jgi:hypothetical protein
VAGLQKELAKNKMKKFTATNTKVAVDFIVKVMEISDGRQKKLSKELMTSTLRIVIKECIVQQFKLDKREDFAMVDLANYLQGIVTTIGSFQEFCTHLVEKVTEIANINKQSALYTGVDITESTSTKDYNSSSRRDGNLNSTKDYNSSSRKDLNSTSTKDYNSSSSKKEGIKSEVKRKRSPSRERNSKDSKEQRTNQNKPNSNSNSNDVTCFLTTAAEHLKVVEKVKEEGITEKDDQECCTGCGRDRHGLSSCNFLTHPAINLTGDSWTNTSQAQIHSDYAKWNKWILCSYLNKEGEKIHFENQLVKEKQDKFNNNKKGGGKQILRISDESENLTLDFAIQLIDRSFAQIATNLDSGARPGNFISYEWIQKNIPEAWKEPSLEKLQNSSDSVRCMWIVW